MEMILSVEGMTCSHCVARVSNALSTIKGVTYIKVDLAKHIATVRLESPLEHELKSVVEGAGYVVKSVQWA